MPPESSSPPRPFFSWVPRLHEGLIVTLAAIASLAVHGHFRVPGMGELDAARFGRIAYLWHVRGKLSFDDVGYQIRTSTLYLQLEKVALDHGLPLASLPSVVNWTSVVFGTATSVALYVLFRRLTNRPIAATATLIHVLTPGFWLGNIYGMPTVPGMFWFVLAVILFWDASRAERSRSGLVLRLAAAWLCLTLAMMFKSDLVLGGGAFLGVALVRSTQRVRFAAYAAAVVFGATLGSIGYAHAVVLPSTQAATASVGLIEFFKKWNASFAVSLDALLTDSNNSTITRCVGGLLFGVIVFTLLYGLVIGGRSRKQALLAMLWGVPPILAWGVRFGNSARHNVPAFPPLILFAVIVLFEITRHETRRAATLAACIVLLSYFSNTQGEDSLRPQSNLIRLSEVMDHYTAKMHARARALVEQPSAKLAVVAGYADPYTEFEVLSHCKHPVIEIGEAWVIKDEDRETVIDYSAYERRISVRALARKLQRAGYDVVSLSYRF